MLVRIESPALNRNVQVWAFTWGPLLACTFLLDLGRSIEVLVRYYQSLPSMFLLALLYSIKHNQAMIAMLQENWITVRQAADLIGCRVQHVRLLARNNQLKAARIGDKIWVIEKTSAEKYAKDKKNTGRPRSK